MPAQVLFWDVFDLFFEVPGGPPDRFAGNMLEEQMETARKEKTSLSLMQSSETDARPTGHPGRKMVFGT